MKSISKELKEMNISDLKWIYSHVYFKSTKSTSKSNIIKLLLQPLTNKKYKMTNEEGTVYLPPDIAHIRMASFLGPEDVNRFKATSRESSETPGWFKEAIKLGKTDFRNVDLSYADLSDVNFRDVIFKDVNLRGAILTHVKSGNIQGEPIDLPDDYRIDNGYLIGPGVNLKGADLSGLDLSNVNLTHANLTNANIKGTNFSGVLLHGTIGLDFGPNLDEIEDGEVSYVEVSDVEVVDI